MIGDPTMREETLGRIAEGPSPATADYLEKHTLSPEEKVSASPAVYVSHCGVYASHCAVCMCLAHCVSLTVGSRGKFDIVSV